ncbi:hypothetical protein, partial [Bradyrhizobium sp. URHD0069]|uniref:hypothetical protein n=1 Tax=Bradyrhizobium sp. URHD0069 TaxID=1380355 RepID=UPI001AEBB5E4
FMKHPNLVSIKPAAAQLANQQGSLAELLVASFVNLKCSIVGKNTASSKASSLAHGSGRSA